MIAGPAQRERQAKPGKAGQGRLEQAGVFRSKLAADEGCGGARIG